MSARYPGWATVLAASIVSATLLFSTELAAQTGGTIEGRLIRADGTGIGGVSIVLDQKSTAQISSPRGDFVFSGVPPGTYSLTLVMGDNVDTIENVIVAEGRTITLGKTLDWKIGFAETLTVRAPSRRVERIVDAPAAVTRVSDFEIQQHAAHAQLPKLVEFTPGAEVTQSGLYDYNLNTRGFNSSLNRRVVTLIDGVDVSIPFLGSQEWAGVAFPMDDLLAVEFVRGPSAALYGANASSGVLNMSTKEPRTSRGGVARFSLGQLDTINVDFRAAWNLGAGWYGKVVGAARRSEDFTVSRATTVEYSRPCPRGGSGDCLPLEAAPLSRVTDRIYVGSIRFDKYLATGPILTVEGGVAHVAGPVVQTGIGRVQLLDVSRPWGRFNFQTSHLTVLAYYSGRRAPKQLSLGSGVNLALTSHRGRVEGQGHWNPAGDKVRLVLGASAGLEKIDSLDSAAGRQTLLFAPVSSTQQAIYGQADWNVSSQLKLVLAARGDTSSLHAFQVSPKASVVYGIRPGNAIRLTYNQAFQVPNHAEFFVQADAAPPVDLSALNGVCAPFGVNCGFGVTRILAVGNKDLKLETIKTWEIGYKGLLRGRGFVTLDYYHSVANDFVTDLLPQLGTPLGRINANFGPWQGPPGLPAQAVAAIRAAAPAILSNNLDGTSILAAVSYTNFGEVHANGLDFGLTWYMPRNWSAAFSYSWFDFSIASGAPGLDGLLLPNSPGQRFVLGGAYNGRLLYGAINLRRVDTFRWAVGPFRGDVDSYTTIDFVANRALNNRVTVGVNVANLLNEEHWESFGGDVIRRRVLASIQYKW